MFSPIRVLTAVVIFFIASVNQATGAPIKLKVAYLTLSASYTHIFVTKDTGIFKKNGLDVELIYIPPAVLTQAMLAREVPIGMSGGSSMIEANLKGADFVILGSVTKAPGLGYFITRREITKVEQLKGKNMGISRFGAAPHRILVLTLKKLGIDPKRDVTFLQIGNPPLLLAAIKQGRVDGGLMSVEMAFAAKKLGLRVLVDIRKLGIEYLTNDMVTTRSFIEKNEDTVRKFVRAIVEGLHYYSTHKEKSMEIMARYMRTKDRKVIEVGYDWMAKEYQRKPYVSIRGIKAVLESIADRNPKAKEAKPEQFYNSKFVKELDESGFIDNLYR